MTSIFVEIRQWSFLVDPIKVMKSQFLSISFILKLLFGTNAKFNSDVLPGTLLYYVECRPSVFFSFFF